MTTKFDQGKIDNAAKRHDDKRTEINDDLERLKVKVNQTVDASMNGATTALDEVCVAWVEGMRKGVFAHLELMAEKIRKAGSQQTEQDRTNQKAILDVPMDVKSFLGGPTV